MKPCFLAVIRSLGYDNSVIKLRCLKKLPTDVKARLSVANSSDRNYCRVTHIYG